MRLNEEPIWLGEAIENGSAPQVTRENATWEQVHKLLQEDPNEGMRSQYQWFRLPNGELICGFYPQEDAYFQATSAIKI